MKKTSVIDPGVLLEKQDEVTDAIPTLLAGLESGLREFDLFSLSLQRLPDGSFRCILRGGWKEGHGDQIRLVSFTNSLSAAKCLVAADHGFGEGAIRWHVDQFAGSNGADGSTKTERKQLTFLK